MNNPRTLVACHTIDDAWADYLLPWFVEAGATAWKSSLPTAVVTPGRAHAVQLLRRLSRERIALFNVRFWSTADLWRQIASSLRLGTTISEQPDMRLVARSAALHVGKLDPNDVSVRTLAQAPDPLLELMRILEAGGWGTDEVEGRSFRSVADRVREILGGAEAESLARRYFEMESVGDHHSPAFQSLAFVGFDAAHFSEFPLLKAAVGLSHSALTLIPDAASRSEALDLVWAGSWESLCGELIPCGDDPLTPLHDLCVAFDDAKAAPGSCSTVPVTFACARDDVMQSQAITHEAAKLVHGGAERVAVVVPNGGALSREISLNLAAAKLPHYCSLSPVTTAADERAWTALLDLLAEPTIGRMVAFTTLYELPESICAVNQERLTAVLRRAADDLLLSNLIAIGAVLAADKPEIASFLTSWPTLPAEASVAAFADQVIALGERLGLPAFGARLRVAIARLGKLADVSVSCDAFCEWARAAVSDPRHSPPEDSAHPAAKIHVLRLHEAVGHEWDHVIFAGQNEGVFPAPERQSGVFSEETLDRLNAQVKVLNETATETGAAGEGQTIVRAGKSLCLGPSARRSLDVRDFLRVLSASQSATMYLSLRDLVRPGAPLQPGSFLSRVFLLIKGKHLTIEMASQMAYACLLAIEVPEDLDAEATRIAFVARRDATQPSGPFDFCLSSAPTWPVNISASGWARAVRTPAIQWMNSFVGVSCTRAQTDASWNKPLGVWVHNWLSEVTGKGFVENPGKAWEGKTIAAAEAFLEKVTQAQQQAGEALPLWWVSLWGQAVSRARYFARSLSTVDLPWAAGELSLKAKPFALPDGLSLPVGGRLDIVFSDRKPENVDNFDGAKLLLSDFKTGADKPLSPDRMLRGEGVQLGLYGLRTRLSGAAETGICLLKPGDEVKVQMTAEQAASLTLIWRVFAQMLATGRFGQIEDVRSDYGLSADFPLATLPIAPEIMEARRERLFLSFGDAARS